MMTNRHSEDFWRAGLWALVRVFGLVGAQLFQHRVKYGADPDRLPPYLLWEQPRAFCERSPVQSSWLVSVVVQAREAIRQHL